MAFFDGFKKWWDNVWSGKAGKLFRGGLEEFLVGNLERAAVLGLGVITQGGFNSGKEFTDLLWAKLRMEFPQSPGTWLRLLVGFVVERFKQEGKL